MAVVASTLAVEFDVSEDAIRRDLRALAAEGRCRRVYGGALPIARATEPLAARLQVDGARKARLGQVAARDIQPGELIFLDSGSTNAAVVSALPGEAGLTVATNAVDIASLVLRRSDLRLIVVGGQADPVIGGCVDATAVQAVEHMRFDRAFIGACAVSAAGVDAYHFADAAFKRAVLASARQAVVLATTDKLTETAPFRVASLAQLSLVVLEADAPDEHRAALLAAGCRNLIQAEPE